MSFIGDQLNVASYFPSIAPGNVLFFDTITVADPGSTITAADWHLVQIPPGHTDILPSMSITADVITITYPVADEGEHLSTGTFNGFQITTPSADPAFGPVSLLRTNIPALSNADITSDGHTIRLNEQNLTLPQGTPGVIQLQMQEPGFITHLGHPVRWAPTGSGLTQITVGIEPNFPNYFLGALIEAEKVWESVANIQFINTPFQPGDDISVGVANLRNVPPTAGDAVAGQTTINDHYAGPAANGDYFLVPTETVVIQDPAEVPVTQISATDWAYHFGNNMVSVALDLAHELGHAIGLNHTNDPNSIMNPIERLPINFHPDTLDVAAIQRLYGPPHAIG